MSNTEQIKFNFNTTWQVWDDFPDHFNHIDTIDMILSESMGCVIPYSHLLLLVECTEKELNAILANYARRQTVFLGRARFCPLHAEVVLDEECYCSACNQKWMEDAVELEKAIEIAIE